ncbi:MAG TPA: SWIM zinc finger family protein [Terracidiphilus sp.]|nr:SWIM zinc finger family protein [Terracidiphilus sp.]
MAGVSLEKIEAIAPDQASLVAARKLVKPGGWLGLSADNSGLIWGECQGSGASPYRVVASEIDAGYKCTCPSRKFPCKHSLALMWMRAEGKIPFESAEGPQWVQDWVRRRRSGTGDAGGAEREEAAQPKSLVRATTDEAEEIDPKAQARAAAARDRSRRERETAIVAGLDDLDRWLMDQVEGGLAGFAVHAGKSCRSIAQRLVDAKAPGLASRLDSLPNRIYSLPEHARAMAAVEQLGQLHILAEAYRRQESLDPNLCADLRREVGWTQARESLLGEEAALCISGRWRVVGAISEVQPDRLRRLETWLWREGATDGPRAAVLLDFVPVASGQTRGAYRTGERMEATLVFYASARPLRALIKEMSSPAEECSAILELPNEDLAGAITEYEDALTRVPWINIWPMRFSEARVRRNGEKLFLCSTSGGRAALPMLMSQVSTVAPLLAMEKIDGFGLWDGYGFRLCFAQTPLGRWVSE